MKLNVDYSVAVKFAEFLSTENYKDKRHKDSFIKYLDQNRSFNKQFQFHEGNMTSKEYFHIIFSILNDNPIESENFVMNVVTNSFKNILSKKDKLQRKIKNIQEYDFTKLENKLLKTLPEGTPLNINIHIVLDGFNAGCILDSSDMLIDAIFWPSDKKNEHQIEGIILHEYHHLGLKYWLNKNKKRKQILKEKSGYELAVKLVESIIGEGAATYFFNQSDNLTDLLEEAYGETIANQYLESLKKAKMDIKTLIKRFEYDLEHLLGNKDKYEEMKESTKDYGFCKEFGQPLDKAIGVYMCKTIERGEGRKGLIEIFKNPSLFLSKYNESAKKINRLEIKEEIVQDWLELWG